MINRLINPQFLQKKLAIIKLHHLQFMSMSLSITMKIFWWSLLMLSS